MRLSVRGLHFSGAHFLVSHEKCEHLHGHNWLVTVRLEGEVGERGMLMDFLKLNEVVSSECGKLDHKVLLPSMNPQVSIQQSGDEIEVKVPGKRFVFPVSDVMILPLREVTAEELANYLLHQIAPKLPSNIRVIEVEVEESPGKSALSRKEL